MVGRDGLGCRKRGGGLDGLEGRQREEWELEGDLEGREGEGWVGNWK